MAQEQRDADYLATKAYSGGRVDLAWLGAARDQLTKDYGTFERYLTEGCGLSSDDLARLRTRLG
ncbi:tyrosine-protein phosphatase [Microlunatus sagamiharensis]|uniref:tyrosine-protein phosphatase n=1 Tax=Microlunatus sagamiharensis TaxID=546874 RepID=UPI001E28C920|nr:tyrosine-protein phosphatase [Microlunatus sagamiharensis]